MSSKGKYNRLQSLDIFRGIIVCSMIIVGASGNYDYTFRMLDHAPWSGFTPTDFIFPSFLFIIGVAQSLSFKPVSNEQTGSGGSPNRSRLLKIGRRTLTLFLLGLLLNWFPFCFRDDSGHIQFISIDQLRILGVLQRIALAFGISSLLELYLSERSLIVLGILSLITYVTILNIGGSPDPYGVQTNIVGRIDRCLLGINHIYREQGAPFDPEGLLSTLPAIVNVLSGYLTGKLIQRYRFELPGLMKGMMTGCLILILGYLWSYFDPINKKLWTSSYALITIGMDIMLFIIIVYLADVQARSLPLASFFTCFGKNPILIYLFSELLMKLLLFPLSHTEGSIYALLYQHVFSSAGMFLGSLLQALAYMLLCWTLVWYLNKKRVFLKI